MTRAKPALQARSKATRDKLVAALERLLRDRPFEEIAVADIAREASLSVGAVYRRFENKDAFIPVLFDLYLARTEAFMAAQIRAAADAPEDLRGALRHALVTGHAIIEENGHLMRAVHLYARIKPELIGAEWAPLIEASRASIEKLVEEYADEITVTDKEAAVDALTYFLNTILIEEGLYGDIGPNILRDLTGAALAREMADFAYGYLVMPR